MLNGRIKAGRAQGSLDLEAVIAHSLEEKISRRVVVGEDVIRPASFLTETRVKRVRVQMIVLGDVWLLSQAFQAGDLKMSF